MMELFQVDASSADFSLRDLLAAQRIMMSVGYMPCSNIVQIVSIDSSKADQLRDSQQMEGHIRAIQRRSRW